MLPKHITHYDGEIFIHVVMDIASIIAIKTMKISKNCYNGSYSYCF